MALFFLFAAQAAGKTCLYECVSDSDCRGCGSGDGVCKGALPTTRICLNDKADPPADPKRLPAAVPWPLVWAGDMYSLDYPDQSNKTQVNSGRFYYDWPNMRQKQDFGGKALIYISEDNKTGVKHSRFYFVFGPVCAYVHTEDPLTHMDITVTRPDWMTVCADLGAGAYVGREQVEGEWVDHYNCSVTYNGETDSFQTWHSLGMGNTPFGLPVALSAGDSTPSWEKPRLNSIWYSNVTVGADVAPAAVFKLPRICIPIPGVDLLEHLGLRTAKSLHTAFTRESTRTSIAEFLQDTQFGSA